MARTLKLKAPRELTVTVSDSDIGPAWRGLSIAVNGGDPVAYVVRVDDPRVLRFERCTDEVTESVVTVRDGVPVACSCDDAKYRPGRPGGCKHCVASRKLLSRLVMVEPVRQCWNCSRPARTGSTWCGSCYEQEMPF